jgi:RNA polymerase sigma-70 factor (ECF subfamily)
LEAELIEKAARGDRSAFGRLIELHYDFIHAVAWKWTRSRVDADDIAQDVCVRLAKAITGFRGEASFRTWLYRLVLNAVHDRARKTSRERRGAEAWGVDPSQRADESDDGLQEIWSAVQTLPPMQRDAVMLVYSEGLGHREAAKILGCSEKTVSWHLHEARKRLRDILGRQVA